MGYHYSTQGRPGNLKPLSRREIKLFKAFSFFVNNSFPKLSGILYGQEVQGLVRDRPHYGLINLPAIDLG